MIYISLQTLETARLAILGLRMGNEKMPSNSYSTYILFQEALLKRVFAAFGRCTLVYVGVYTYRPRRSLQKFS